MPDEPIPHLILWRALEIALKQKRLGPEAVERCLVNTLLDLGFRIVRVSEEEEAR